MESTPKKKKTTEAETSRLDYTQSSAPATTLPPSFFGSTIQTYLREVLQGFHVDIDNINAELITHMNFKMGEMVEYMNKHNQEVLAQQQAQTQALNKVTSLLQSLHEKVDALASSTLTPDTSIPTSDPASTSILVSNPPPIIPPHTTPSNVIFTMTDPSSSTQVDITLDEQATI